jgi:hypothetical protein
MRLLQFEHRIWRQNHIRARNYFLWIWWAGLFGCFVGVDMDRDQRYYDALLSSAAPNNKMMMFGFFVENYHRPYKEGRQSFGEEELNYMIGLFLWEWMNKRE